MPENPLLPDADLRALLARTRRIAASDAVAARRLSPVRRPTPVVAAGREAALAATTMQLRQGDLLVPEPGDSVALALSPRSPAAADADGLVPKQVLKGTPRLVLAAAMASALRESQADGVVLAFARAGAAELQWPAVLSWTQERLLPFLLVCLDASGPGAFRSAGKPLPEVFEWANVSRTATRLKLPVLTVDGEDAVAMYRATQEALLRARAGGGPAILWAALPTVKQLATRPRAQSPLARLTQYLRAREISPS